MDAFFKKKTVAAILFIACLFILSFLNIRSAWRFIEHSAARIFEGGISRVSAAELETAIYAGVYEKYRYIEAYDYLQNMMGEPQGKQ